MGQKEKSQQRRRRKKKATRRKLEKRSNVEAKRREKAKGLISQILQKG